MTASTVLGDPAEKPKILCVDDEPMVLDGLRDGLRRSFDVRTATSGAEGLKLLRASPRGYAVVLSDMRMPEMPGSVFLREAKRVAPLSVRMLLTGYADTEAAIKAVNDGGIFRFLTKPCDRNELLQACAAALWQFRMQTAERDMLEQTLRGAVQALTDVLGLAAPAVFGRGARLKTLAGAIAAEAGRDDGWEIEVAAMLAQLGAITLPGETAEKLYLGAPLTSAEAAMVARVPALSQNILKTIPRLEGVLQILANQPRDFATAEDTPLPIGARILRIAADFLTLEARGVQPQLALDTLRGRDGAYDPELLAAFARSAGIRVSEHVISEVRIADLATGMRLAQAVRSTTGQLLIAEGYPVTPELIERLRNFPDGYVAEPLRVTRPA